MNYNTEVFFFFFNQNTEADHNLIEGEEKKHANTENVALSTT